MVRCSDCGKELEDEEVRYCSICKSPLCIDCTRYMVVMRKTIYKKEYYESIPVCKNCLPEKKLKEKLNKIVDEILRI